MRIATRIRFLTLKRVGANQDFYTAMNLQGQYIFFDNGKGGYYFDDRDVGYCVWFDKQSVDDFILKMEFDIDVLVKKIDKPKI